MENRQFKATVCGIGASTLLFAAPLIAAPLSAKKSRALGFAAQTLVCDPKTMIPSGLIYDGIITVELESNGRFSWQGRSVDQETFFAYARDAAGKKPPYEFAIWVDEDVTSGRLYSVVRQFRQFGAKRISCEVLMKSNK